MKASVLVLDDESSILELLGQLLSEEGYSCTLTTSPLKALRYLAESDFALLITDLKMPEMHGMEVVKRAKQQQPDLAVIVITALLDVTNAIEAMRVGADDYLLKPFNLSEICVAVDKALERRRLIIENEHHRQELEGRIKDATKELENANRALFDMKEYLESLLQSSVDAIFAIDGDGNVTYVNQGASAMFGYSFAELRKTRLQDLLAGGKEELHHLVRLLQDDRSLQNYETEVQTSTGGHMPVNMSISQVRNDRGAIDSFLIICKDITTQKRLEHELKEMSIKDSLTGLYNQRYFYDRLESEIERARRQKHPLSLVLFDIDRFKHYNDRHGHLEGDRVLQGAAQALLESTRGHVDLGFRYGGDEFTVILPEAAASQALSIAERIRAGFEARHFDSLKLSLGLATYREGWSTRAFIRAADIMMYEAKRAGGNRVSVYSAANEPENAASEIDIETAATQ